MIDATEDFDKACEAHSGKLLPHMTTADSARDMDQIREALGEPKLTYLGFSYGTFLGTVYAGLFPDHVRALVARRRRRSQPQLRRTGHHPGGGVREGPRQLPRRLRDGIGHARSTTAASPARRSMH